MSTRRTSSVTDLALVAVFAGLIAAFTLAPAVPVGTAGVPITLQTLAIGITAMVLGPWRAGAATLLYLALGFAGLPIFAQGNSGLGMFARPSIGYLLAFPLMAVVVGLLARWVVERTSRARWVWLFGAGLAGSLLTVHPLGITGLALVGKMSIEKAFMTDLAFIPGDIIKNMIAAAVAVAVHKAFPTLLGRRTAGDLPVQERVTVS